MKLEIKKIKLDELEDFVNSKTFREFEYIPISPIRAKSYTTNPHVHTNDFVLYLGFIENKLVTFRSLFPDLVNVGDEQIRFAWCSGTWVHPNFRRKGFSELLLKEAYIDWNQKLMITNYTASSENLILKTGWFKSIHQFKGLRAYLFPKTIKLVLKDNNNLAYKTILSFTDCLIATYSTIRLWFFYEKPTSATTFKALEFPDEQCYETINQSKTVFNRGVKEINWIFENPWITSEKSELTKKYPFSSFSDSFRYTTIKVFSETEFVGFFIFSLREGHLKTLFWHLPKGFEKEIAIYLKLFCKENKIEMVTIYKKELADELFKRKFPFLHTKKYGQNIYSTFQIKNNSEFIFQDGDGDVIFT